MESIEAQLDENDFGVFIFSPDDVINIRGQVAFITRDNTLFEMGLFWGKLRRGRVFFIVPKNIPEDVENPVNVYHLPSDLAGLTLLKYEIKENIDAGVSVASRRIIKKIKELKHFQDPKEQLIEANNKMDQDYAIIRFLRKFSKGILKDPTQKYQLLWETLLSAYLPPETYKVEGIGIWRAINDGLKQIAGNEGRGGYFDFNVNQGKKEAERMVVVDCYLNNEDKVLIKTNTHFDKTYVLCYSIGKELVLTVAITGKQLLEEKDFDQVFLNNHNLLGTINNLFGGASN